MFSQVGGYSIREHYHVTIVSENISAPTFVTKSKFAAYEHYNKAVMGYCILLGAKVVNMTPTAALFDDGSAIRCFACSQSCMEDHKDDAEVLAEIT